MANLIISYDLNSPGQSYDRVIATIKSLGGWAKMAKSLWFVSTGHSAMAAHNIVKAVMDINDTLVVVDATTNDAAWSGVSQIASDYVSKNWIR